MGQRDNTYLYESGTQFKRWLTEMGLVVMPETQDEKGSKERPRDGRALHENLET